MDFDDNGSARDALSNEMQRYFLKQNKKDVNWRRRCILLYTASCVEQLRRDNLVFLIILFYFLLVQINYFLLFLLFV